MRMGMAIRLPRRPETEFCERWDFNCLPSIRVAAQRRCLFIVVVAKLVKVRGLCGVFQR
jgi:hypothetical protein